MKKYIRQYLVLMWLPAILISCAGSPPTQEMNTARDSVKSAQSQGAENLFPKLMRAATEHLEAAEKYFAQRSYRSAKKEALSAAEKGRLAVEIADVFNQANDAIEEAKKVNYIWRDTEKTFRKAKSLADNGDTEKATKLAKRVRMESVNAVNQYKMEYAKGMVLRLLSTGRITGSQQSRIEAIRKALQEQDGDKAFNISAQL